MISAETIRQLLDYNPATGEFTWLPRDETGHFVVGWNKKFAGATRAQNSHNVKLLKRNKTGVKGVCFDNTHQKYISQIACNGIHRRLGYFDTIEEAHQVYVAAAKLHHGEFARFE